MAKKTVGENPLLSKNIPPPPLDQNGIMVKEDSGKAVSEQSGITVKGQTAIASKRAMREEEKATIEISLYLRPNQDEKLEDLRREYKRHTGKKISINEAIRRLVEKATLESLL